MEAVQELIKDQDVNSADEDGTTALHEGALSGMCKFLVTWAKIFNLQHKFLENEKIVEWLLKNGAKVNSLTKSGSSPLLGSAFQGSYNKNYKAKKKRLNLQIMSNHLTSGYEKNADLLIKNGADVNLANKNGATPLHIASFNGDMK